MTPKAEHSPYHDKQPLCHDLPAGPLGNCPQFEEHDERE